MQVLLGLLSVAAGVAVLFVVIPAVLFTWSRAISAGWYNGRASTYLREGNTHV